MVIRASTSKEVDMLLGELRSEQPVVRDGAVARLTVIGTRAVQRLLTLAQDVAAPMAGRAAAWKALEGIGDERALQPGIAVARGSEGQDGVAATGVIRGFLRGPHAVPALDTLTGIALDRARSTEIRVAAIRALADVEPATVKPLFTSLAADPDPAVAAAAGSGGDQDSPDAREILAGAAGGQLPDTAGVLRASLARAAGDVPLTLLHQVIETIRKREEQLSKAGRDEWRAARAAAHLALAQRDSRLALYDLRETLEKAEAPVAVEFLSALTIVGDATCLEPIAMASSRTTSAEHAWWRERLRDAFHAIVERHGITKRHAAMKRIQKRWPGALQTLGFRL